MIDGHSRLGALVLIVLRLSAPGIAAVAIFTFTGAWNELLFALVLITSEKPAHGAAGAQLSHHQRRPALGSADGGRGAVVGAADDPLLRRPALHGRWA